MPQGQRLATPLPVGAAIPAGSLRAELERRRANGEKFTVSEAISIVVPLCIDIARHHQRGERLFAHPSSILVGPAGTVQIASELARALPVMPRDRAALAPEERHGQAGDARSSVFTIGAILYELLTGEVVGPGMRRPSDLVPGLHPGVEGILGKALVADAAHRPDDLGALAQALHHLAPSASVAPPPADESHLDHAPGFDVDVSLSMLPPAPHAPPSRVGPANSSPDPYTMRVEQAVYAPSANDPTAQLADLKGRLESDPRPRYVVIKDGMDHGPFSAVELLQQVASHAFEEDHILRDSFSNDERPIKDWEEFAPFAEQAKLNREIVAEKKEIARVVVAEAQGTRAKTFMGLGILFAVLLAAGFWFFEVRGARRDAIAVASEDGINVETAGGLKGGARSKRPGGGGGVGASGLPVLPGGMSCEAARARYVEEINVGGARGQADLTAGQFGSVLNNGSYIVGCGTPSSMHVNVCAAVQNGRAVGVTVTTEPHNGQIAGCISGAVRRMSFPSNPKLDIATTRF